MPSPLDSADLRRRVQDCLDAELATQGGVLAELGPDVDDLLTAVADLLRGGKRLAGGLPLLGAPGRRSPGLRGAGAPRQRHGAVPGRGPDPRRRHGRLRAPARGCRPPTARSQRPPRARLGRRRDRFGLAGAVLAGNLCLTWTDEVYATCGLTRPTSRGRPVFDTMRTQLMAGQFLDVVESMRPWTGVDADERVQRADRVIRYKSAKYTIEHPLLIGATTGGPRRRPRRALALRADPRTSLPAARRPPRRLRRPGRRASPPATTCARASAPCCSRTHCRDRHRPRRGSRSLGRGDLDASRSTSSAAPSRGSGAVVRCRGRDLPPPARARATAARWGTAVARPHGSRGAPRARRHRDRTVLLRRPWARRPPPSPGDGPRS